MSIEIDCESKESALECLAKIFSCSIEVFSDALLALDIDDIYHNAESPILIPSEEYLLNFVTEKLGHPKEFTSVCWFHTTRTTKENEFSEGIYPLDSVLDILWETLISNAPSSETKDQLALMKESGVVNHHYLDKTTNPIHSGPYAILVRDVALHANELSQHDYLEIPEIIEDICDGYPGNSFSLCQHYSGILLPKIVKFRSAYRLDEGCLESALYYAYNCVRNLPPCGGSVTCFDGDGSLVPKDSIISISTVSPS